MKDHLSSNMADQMSLLTKPVLISEWEGMKAEIERLTREVKVHLAWQEAARAEIERLTKEIARLRAALERIQHGYDVHAEDMQKLAREALAEVKP